MLYAVGKGGRVAYSTRLLLLLQKKQICILSIYVDCIQDGWRVVPEHVVFLCRLKKTNWLFATQEKECAMRRSNDVLNMAVDKPAGLACMLFTLHCLPVVPLGAIV